MGGYGSRVIAGLSTVLPVPARDNGGSKEMAGDTNSGALFSFLENLSSSSDQQATDGAMQLEASKLHGPEKYIPDYMSMGFQMEHSVWCMSQEVSRCSSQYIETWPQDSHSFTLAAKKRCLSLLRMR
jgi:hypothetical protein